MTITAALIGLTSAFIGSLGFALLFRLHPRHLVPASLGGMIGYAVYLAADLLGMHLFVSNFLAATVAALLSELCARFFKAPSVIFTIPALIPLVPGSLLYYSMSNLLTSQYDQAFLYFSGTLVTALGIAGGMIAVSVGWSIFSYFYRKPRSKQANP